MKVQGVLILCCVLLAKGQEIATDPAVDKNHTTTQTPPETTTVTVPTTTKATTTEATTTTSSTEPPTTPSTKATTTAKPSPAPTPTPDYPRNVGKWSVEDDGNRTCIALKGAMQITVVHENKTEILNIPSTASANGTCTETGDNSDKQTLVLTWDSTTSGTLNRLELTFERNITKSVNAEVGSITVGKYGLNDVAATLYLNSTNATEFKLSNIGRFQTPANHSYSCLAEEAVKTTTGDFNLKIREVQLEAFRVSQPGHKEFSAAIQCAADDATDVVPIAVGAALAGLVVIVLIAYLIGRKRSRARGYQSV